MAMTSPPRRAESRSGGVPAMRPEPGACTFDTFWSSASGGGATGGCAVLMISGRLDGGSYDGTDGIELPGSGATGGAECAQFGRCGRDRALNSKGIGRLGRATGGENGEGDAGEDSGCEGSGGEGSGCKGSGCEGSGCKGSGGEGSGRRDAGGDQSGEGGVGASGATDVKLVPPPQTQQIDVALPHIHW